MNEYGQEDETGQENGISQLRKLAKNAKAVIQENEALKQRLEALEARSTVRDLNRAFASRGVKPQAAELYTGDGSDESIDAWVEKYSEVLGLRNSDGEGDDPSTIKASDQEAFEMMRNMATDRKVVLDLESRMNNAQSKEEVMAIVEEAKGLGVPY